MSPIEHTLSAMSVEAISVPLVLALTAVAGIATASIGLGAIVGQLKRAVAELDRLARAVEDLRERVIKLETRIDRRINE
jgi:hypothetical protein